MIRTSEFVLNFVVNSVWQIPAIFIASLLGVFVLKNCTAQYRHILWIVALALCLIVPAISAAGLKPLFLSRTEPAVATPQPLEVPADDVETSPLQRARKFNRRIEISGSKLIKLSVACYGLFLLCGVRLVRQWIRKVRLEASVTDVGLPIHVETTAMYCRRLFQLKDVNVV